jgi:hypothetical protein
MAPAKRGEPEPMSVRVPTVGSTVPDVPPPGGAPAGAAPATPRSMQPAPSLFSNADLNQLRALEKVALFAGQGGDDDDDDDMAGGNSFEAPPVTRRPWWRARRLVEGVVALALAVVLAGVAGALHATIWVRRRREGGGPGPRARAAALGRRRAHASALGPCSFLSHLLSFLPLRTVCPPSCCSSTSWPASPSPTQ